MPARGRGRARSPTTEAPRASEIRRIRILRLDRSAGRVLIVSANDVGRVVPPSTSMDTSLEAEEILLDAYRRMSPAEKLGCVEALNRSVEAMASARLRSQYGPDLSREELEIRLASLRLDQQTMVEVFHWDPEARGL